MTRLPLRIGDIFYDRATMTRGWKIVSVEPLRGRRIGDPAWWNAADERESALDPEALLAEFRLYQDGDVDDDELRDALVGRRIVAMQREHAEDEFPQGDGTTTLTLHDGSAVTFSGFSAWGYDASGCTANLNGRPVDAERAELRK